MQTGLNHFCNYEVQTVMMTSSRRAEIPGVSSKPLVHMLTCPTTLVTPGTGNRYPFKDWKDADWRPLSRDSGV